MRMLEGSRVAFLPLVAALYVGAPADALAESADAQARIAARTLANEAANAYARGDYARAHELCDRAYEIVPAPTIALLNARSLVRLARWVEAIELYNRVTSEPLEPDAPEAFRRAVREADAELAALKPRVPRLKVVLNGFARPAEVSVSLDDRSVRSALHGVWVFADPRVHSLRVHSEGTNATVTELTLREGESRVITVEPSGGAQADPLRSWGFVGLGLAGTGLALGVITGAMAMDARRDALRDCPNQRCEEGSRGADALERFRTYRAVSTVGYAVGAVAGAAGGLILLRSGSGSEPDLSISATAGGLRVTGSL